MYAAKKPINKQANIKMIKPNNKVFVRPGFGEDGDDIDALAIQNLFPKLLFILILNFKIMFSI